MRLRNQAYDFGWLRQHEVGAPVLSIGNLTAGGTGKTPLTSYFVSSFQSMGWRVGVISRGYGRQSKACERVAVDGSHESALRFGDEPSWLAHRHPLIPVYVGADKVATARTLLKDEKIDLILADDAFQHRRLRRQIDVVILDASEPEWHYRSLPRGRLREGFDSLRRAHLVVLTKTNLVPRDRVEWLRELILKNRDESQLFEFESVISGFALLGCEASSSEPLERAKNSERERGERLFLAKRLFLASGIGRPETFSKLVALASGSEIVGHLIFKDHHSYSSHDLQLIEETALARGASAIVVTEKDAVKLTDWKPRIPCLVSRLEVRPVTQLEGFYTHVAQSVFGLGV